MKRVKLKEEVKVFTMDLCANIGDHTRAQASRHCPQVGSSSARSHASASATR
jgi:hypothetical protein